MDAYIFNTALYCTKCADGLPESNTNDSEISRQGPYADGGGEADSPQHCNTCGIFLKNPLTGDGRVYVQDVVDIHALTGYGRYAAQWGEFYDIKPTWLTTFEE